MTESKACNDTLATRVRVREMDVSKESGSANERSFVDCTMSRDEHRDSHSIEENINSRSHRGEERGKSEPMGEDPYQVLPYLVEVF